MKDPSTPEEWQEAVDAAAAGRALADYKMYGLVEGGPSINIARCDSILERGRCRGITPSRPALDLALALIDGINAPDA